MRPTARNLLKITAIIEKSVLESRPNFEVIGFWLRHLLLYRLGIGIELE